MRRLAILLSLAALILAGCGDDDDEAPTEAPPPVEEADPGPPADEQDAPAGLGQVMNAVETIEEEAASAGEAAGREGFTDNDLLPTEDGAALLMDRDYINERRFCRAVEAVTQAEFDEDLAAQLDEAGLELGYDMEAFEAGWDRGAPDDLQGLGGGLYNALFLRC